MLPRIVRSPVEICFGTRPSQAPKSRPFENASPVPIAATIALEMIGPMPGTASALTDQPLTQAVERLQIELLGGLCRDELHGRALHCLGDRLGIPEVILLSLGIGAHALRRHQ